MRLRSVSSRASSDPTQDPATRDRTLTTRRLHRFKQVDPHLQEWIIARAMRHPDTIRAAPTHPRLPPHPLL